MSNILFYDGQCALCRREIQWLNQHKKSELTLLDTHTTNLEKYKVDKVSLLSVLHYHRADGVWLTGLDATVAAWQHTVFGFAFLPLRWPIIKPIADYCYQRWASKRACRLGYK